MRIHHLQHVLFEGLSSMEAVLKAKGHQLTSTHLYDNEALPSVDNIDWLIVMGGPMGIHDEAIYPWLETEKKFIKQAIDSGKKVLGVCLGAQMIADVLGAKVYKGEHKEIGWFDIARSSGIKDTLLSSVMPDKTTVFHWHGDTFDIPEGAIALAASEACKNQGFIYDDRVIAFQFHLETTLESATALIEHCGDELDGSKYVQAADEMLADVQRFTSINMIMVGILEALEK
jgi:GMP synthase-like glutamine amidotransferase